MSIVVEISEGRVGAVYDRTLFQLEGGVGEPDQLSFSTHPRTAIGIRTLKLSSGEGRWARR